MPDIAMLERIAAGSPAGTTLIPWDWRTAPAPDRIADIELLVSDFSVAGPGPELYARMPGLTHVQLCSSGYEGWVRDLPATVGLSTGRGLHGASTAEAALAGVLSLLRRIPDAVAQQQRQIWDPLDVNVLGGRRVTVVGAGDIGRRLRTVLEALGCPVTTVGRSARDGVAPSTDLPELARTTDVLVLAVPLDDSTRGLVDARVLAALPAGAVVANVARGAVVDTDALAAHVSAGRVSAYLDVTDPEPLPAGHPLWTCPQVLITPHTGGGAIDWRERYADLVRDQLDRHARGLPLLHTVGTPG
ncbi:hypothetical protein GIS00_04560 [Nakamurella sp. YIM 132087]|uniref:D-isomer specific 2-hydroxyacid dehydrogenase NAD-binding domain-containing protein n=1 Tax=Nakamurella alba TaxID=2665158 RepID=A0A7K1FGI7_9ACTN|nr:NAD(P)-dependent oxidoreductase [Nakamurella alba]MTD13218.1 hypothetical protein [Nakamurella alba]